MKNVVLVLVLVLAMAGSAFALADVGNNGIGYNAGSDNIYNTGNNNQIGGTSVGGSITNTATGGTGGAGGNAVNNVGQVIGIGSNNRNFSPSAEASVGDIRNTNTNTNIVAPVQINDQDQKQQQKQQQTSINTNLNVNDNTAISTSKSKAESNALNANNQNINMQFQDTRELPAALPIIPQVIPLIQGGRVGDVTGQVVKFAIPAKPYNGELVVEILKVRNGSIFDRVRLEDIEVDLLSTYNSLIAGRKWYEEDKSPNAKARKNNYAKKENIRYLVQYKDSAMGTGASIGSTGSVSGLAGGAANYGGTGSVGGTLGYTRSTADPMYIIKFFLVQ